MAGRGEPAAARKWAGTEVKLDDEDVVIMKESDIMGVIEGRKRTKKAA